METKLTLNAVTPVPTVSPSPAPSAGSAAARMLDGGADLRLVIEEDRASGLFIYKTIDRRTGDVVQVLPREEVIRAADAYATGRVIDTKA